MRLLADVNHRFLVVENQQPSERDTIAHQLFRCIDSIADDPMTNDTFRNSLQWWNEQQANRKQEEDELRDARDELANLQADHELVKKDLEKLRLKRRCLKDGSSNVSSKRDKICEIEKTLAEIRLIESETDQFTTDNAEVKEELRRVKEEERVLHEQEDTLKALEGKVMQTFDKKIKKYEDACTDVILERDEGIATLEKAAAEIDKVMKNTTIIAKVAVFSAGIAGEAFLTVGTVLLLGGITAAAGIPLMVVGGLVGGAGSATAIGGSIGQMVERNKILKQAKEWLEENKKMCQGLISAHEGLTEEHDHIVELFPCINAELPKGTKDVGGIVNIWKDIGQHSAEDAALLVAKAAAAGSDLGVAQGVLEGIDAGAEVAALCAKLLLKMLEVWPLDCLVWS